MIDIVPIINLFEIEYGNQLDLNKQRQTPCGTNFVNRSEKNLGISARVEKIYTINPYSPGLITVALGGSVLSSFVQPKEFYTGQNVKVLFPKYKMSNLVKKFYCLCISRNAFRYTACGREANTTFNNLGIPDLDYAEKYTKKISPIKMPSRRPLGKGLTHLNIKKWTDFRYDELFEIKKGKRLTKENMTAGRTPFIGSIDSNNGQRQYVSVNPDHSENTITVNYNGSVAEAFYQSSPFCASDDVNVLYPKFELNPYIALFLCALIRQEKYRFNYGRKWHLGRMNETIIKLPTNSNGHPDWQFMENYIKSLPYSSNL